MNNSMYEFEKLCNMVSKLTPFEVQTVALIVNAMIQEKEYMNRMYVNAERESNE